jgi:riboflavin kinase/FMN adenylyltransferase
MPISSSFIREQITQGCVEIAQSLLGRSYCLSGCIVSGDKKGRQLGFPTANIELDTHYVIPKYGVYACLVEVKIAQEPPQLLPAVLNCGVRPSICEGLKQQIEAHILDFNADLYGKKVRFHLKKQLRPEIKFLNLEQLKKQISEDVLEARHYFKL